jgi:hypothetical protein
MSRLYFLDDFNVRQHHCLCFSAAAYRPNSAGAHTTPNPSKFSMKDMLNRAPLQ